MSNLKSIEITVTPDLADRFDYNNSHGCPLFHAIKIAGMDVCYVTPECVHLKNNKRFAIIPPFTATEYRTIKSSNVSFTCTLIPLSLF